MGILSKVLETRTDSTGSLRKTKVTPFALENTKIIIPDNLKFDKRRNIGTINGASAETSPVYFNLNNPRKRSSARSPISKISIDPIFNSFTSILSAIIGKHAFKNERKNEIFVVVYIIIEILKMPRKNKVPYYQKLFQENASLPIYMRTPRSKLMLYPFIALWGSVWGTINMIRHIRESKSIFTLFYFNL
ncbi:hypothetical protein PORY_000887 [Pneumocystis oryctolagi]|uniref:Uncharacterized protein n=1 Tax=Pneumocystis oryctolagi TaxID=42067 RepID=A0ACB7CFV7_9ASCO|nr:hypothetical protein PORY_000887 [Pneumocystis oryctolagi]